MSPDPSVAIFVLEMLMKGIIHCRSYRWNIFVLPQFMELF